MTISEEPNPKTKIAVHPLNGRLDELSRKELQKYFDDMLKRTQWFVFDCSQLDFIDSSGLGTLLTCLRKAENAGGKIRLAGLSAKVKMVFDITGAGSLFAFDASAEDAIASLIE
jgi:anti-sigma B factor antagonist